jgi:hypothetical protein
VARSAAVACVVGALTALVTFAGCDGNVIRLGNGPCLHAQVPSAEVLWVGDSWQLVPTGAEPHTEVRNLARVAGAIGPSDDYTIKAAAAATMATIAAQYTTEETSATKVKVLIMDGGTWDTITSNTSATVTSVADTFTQLLSTVATDGTVIAVIYFLTPELSGIPGVPELRPLLEQSCASSAVPCYFLDLQRFWTDPSAYNTATNPPVPTQAGASVIGDQIWAIMQANCIAQ